MIRIRYTTDLPFLAAVGSNGRHVGIIVNPELHGPLSLQDKERLFNSLMAEFEHNPGVTVASPEVQASAVIIDLSAALIRRADLASHCTQRRTST